MLLSLANEKQGDGSYSESNEKTCCNPMCNSFGVPVLDAVTESQGDEAHADEADSAKGIEKLVFVAELIIHILCVGYYSAACENSPEPEVSLAVFAEKRQSAKLGSGVVTPEKRQSQAIDKSEQEPDDANRFVENPFF